MAAHWNDMSFEKFIKHEGVEQSRMVATYETALMIEAVTSAHPVKKPKKRGHSGS